MSEESPACGGPILLTNDDGIDSVGLLALVRAFAARYGDRVVVVAPEAEQSAVGHAVTMRRPLTQRRHFFPGLPQVTAHAVSGTPVDCVKLAVHHLLAAPPILVCAGINHGPNLGTDVVYSGTVAAAREAAILGLPGLAVSQIVPTGDAHALAAGVASALAAAVLEHGLPPDTFLNVNVPAVPAGGASAAPSLTLATLGVRCYRSIFERVGDAAGQESYILRGENLDQRGVPGTDIAAVGRGLVAVTPIGLDQTNHAAVAALGRWLH